MDVDEAEGYIKTALLGGHGRCSKMRSSMPSAEVSARHESADDHDIMAIECKLGLERWR